MGGCVDWIEECKTGLEAAHANQSICCYALDLYRFGVVCGSPFFIGGIHVCEHSFYDE